MLSYFMCSLQLCAELKQVQTKLVQVEQSFHTQVAECERQQQKIRELELELARNSTNRSATTSLQEELQTERARLIAADKKVCAFKKSLPGGYTAGINQGLKISFGSMILSMKQIS